MPLLHCLTSFAAPLVLADAFKPKHLISPNIHVILVHYPLGVFVLGLFLEVFSFLWRRSTVRIAARWMILFGGLLAVPAAMTGIDALEDVGAHNDYKNEQGIHTLSPNQWTLMQKHVLLTGIGSGVAAIAVTIGLAYSDLRRRRWLLVDGPLLILLIGAAGLLTFGSHFGGEGIYLESVAVKLRGNAAEGFEYFAPARSVHVLMAGLAIAVSLGALGVSMRFVAMHRLLVQDAEADEELSALTAPAAAIGPEGGVPAGETTVIHRVSDDVSIARPLSPDAALPHARIPTSRFWVLSTLLFFAALVFGVWVLESREMGKSFSELSVSGVSRDVWELAKHPGVDNRKAAHVIVGAILVVLPIFLAAAVRWGARRRLLVGALCTLMVLLIAAEIWLGVLLIYAGAEGPIYRFAPPASTSGQTALVAPRPPPPPLMTPA